MLASTFGRLTCQSVSATMAGRLLPLGSMSWIAGEIVRGPRDMFYVYLLIEAPGGEPRYVGKTSDPWNRLCAHLAGGSTASRPMRLLAAQLRAKGATLRMLILSVHETELAALQAEAWAIDEYTAKGAKLANCPPGYDRSTRQNRPAPKPATPCAPNSISDHTAHGPLSGTQLHAITMKLLDQ